MEAVVMLIAMILASRWVMTRFNVPETIGSTIFLGLVALGILAPAEIAGVLWSTPEATGAASRPEREVGKAN
jgi:hypothetical protein